MDDGIELATYPGLDPRVTIVRAGSLVDAVFVRTARFDILVDTLDTPERCRAALRRLGAGEDRPLLAVNSHMDWDHFWGNAALDEVVPVIAHSHALARFHDPAVPGVLRRKAEEDARFRDVVLRAPTLTFSDRMRLDGGDLTLELFPTPGHTPDHIAVWIPEIATCLAVDTVERPVPKVWSDGPGHLDALLQSMRRIQSLGAAHVVLAHGQTSSPHVVGENLAYFAAIAQAVTRLDPAAAAPDDLDRRDGFRLGDFVTLPEDWPDDERAFYERFHRANLAAASGRHRDAG